MRPLVRYVQADITDEKSFAALPQQDVYAVVHFAGALPAYMEGYDPRRYVDANVMGTLNVLEYARTAGADRVLYTQTISDYTGYFGEMIELADDMPRKPAMTGDHAVYAITKIAAEELCWHYRAAYGMGFFAFRLPNIYCFMHDSKTLYHDGKPRRKLLSPDDRQGAGWRAVGDLGRSHQGHGPHLREGFLPDDRESPIRS